MCTCKDIYVQQRRLRVEEAKALELILLVVVVVVVISVGWTSKKDNHS